MTAGDEVFRQIQRTARSIAAKDGRRAPTSELLTRHALESFLDRLSRSEHGQDFVLKGGVLLAVYGFRRSTRDVDAEAIRANVTPEHITRVMRDVADTHAEDGLDFDLATLHVQEIRKAAERRKEGLEGVCQERLDDQMATVAAIVDPVFGRGLRA